MNLNHPSNSPNILPYDGYAEYHESFLTISEASDYYQLFFTQVNWEHDLVRMFGKDITTKRKVAWFSDDHKSYCYAGKTKSPLPFNTHLTELKHKIEAYSGSTFNACLMNLYHDGSEAMGWHSDNEKTLVPHACIASLSLGADRCFRFKHPQRKMIISLKLSAGSLLLMKNETQDHWKHEIKKEQSVNTPRINLTFRLMR